MSLPTVNSCFCGLLPLKTGAYISAIVTALVELSVHGHLSLQRTLGQSDFQYIYTVLIIVGIICCLLLLWGIYSGSSTLVNIWVLIYAIILIISMGMFIYHTLKSKSIGDQVIDIIVYWLIIGYCWIVVYSYSKGG